MTNGGHLESAYERISDWWMQHVLYDPAHDFQLEAVFEESHCILGGLKRLQFLGPESGDDEVELISDRPEPGSGKLEDAMVRNDLKSEGGMVDEVTRLQAGIAAFCDRVQSTQGIQGAEDALFMGYGLRRRDGMIEHSCVADQGSSANAVLDAVRILGDHPNREGWLQTIERWVGWVRREFIGPDGGIGSGTVSFEWNPMPVYWCATTLFTAALFRLARLTGRSDDVEEAMDGLGWLARFDFAKAVIPDFSTSPGGVLLYLSEGLVEGLDFLERTEGREVARNHPAAAKATEVLTWLVEHQSERGSWPEPPIRGHRTYEIGLPWLILRMNRILGPDPRWEASADRFLRHLVSDAGVDTYGLFVRPWAMGLAQLSLGERLIGID